MNHSAILIILLISLIGGVSLAYAIRRKLIRDKELALIKSRIEEIVQDLSEEIQSKHEYLKLALLADDHYFSHSEMEEFMKSNVILLEKLDYINDHDAFLEFGDESVAGDLYRLLKNLDSERVAHNKSFVSNELSENKSFFDGVLSYPLDSQQRESIVDLEDNCLVVSSAGSGKTSTMIGKLRYLVDKRKISPDRILTITYTHKAADELTSRLAGTGLQCLTFHKLALNIVSRVEGASPTICPQGLFQAVYYDKYLDDTFREDLLRYIVDYKSLTMDEHSYESSVEYYADRKKNGVLALFPDMDGRTIVTASEQEKKLCHYLTELGVSFRYEETYEKDVYTEDYRQYKPDFSIYYTDKNGVAHRLYLEHFGIDRYGNVPKWFGRGFKGGWYEANQEYLAGIEWKKGIHEKHGTILLSTTSADFYDGTIKQKLIRLLESAGVPINPVPKDELLNRIRSRSKSVEVAIMQMAQGFINLVKANGKTVDEICEVARENGNKRDVFVIERIMKPLWDEYHAALKRRRELDFTDIINKATQYCSEGQWPKRYEYILIDEFQDISIDRYRFLLALRSDLPKTKLYCVGDDWQSIYRFSGSDMSLFSRFPDYFGFTDELRIETTYRFGNPLIDKSSRFVQRNPLQKKKNIRPKQKGVPETKLDFVAYKNDKHLQELVSTLVSRVPAEKSIYIISRYNYDVKALLPANQNVSFDANTNSVVLQLGGRRVTFMTIHSSKGLEADYVFLINCNSGLYGFPSLVSDDPVLDYVLSEKEHYSYAEERRVFYVGITRAREHTVVFYDERRPSVFVSELHKPAVDDAQPCPLCGEGHKVLKYTGIARNKNTYTVWGCDNTEANCQYFERDFQNQMRLNKTGFSHKF